MVSVPPSLRRCAPARAGTTDPQLIPVLHRRAAAWHQEHGLPVDAVRHALAAEDVATAGDLITTDYFQVANDGELSTVLGWFDAIGEPAVRGDTKLLVARAMTALIANDLNVAKSWIDLAVSVDADGGGQLRADVGAKDALVQQIYSYARGDMGQALDWSREALRLIPQNQVWYDLSRSNAAFVETRLGHFDEAVEGHLRTLAQADANNHHLLAVRAIGGLCKLFVLRGERDAAREWLDRAHNDVRFRILDEHYQTHRRHLVRGWLDLATAGRSSLNRSSPGPISWYAGARPGWNTSKCSTRWPAHASDSPATATRPGYGPRRIRFSAPVRIREVSRPPDETRRPPRTPVCSARTVTEREAGWCSRCRRRARRRGIRRDARPERTNREAHLRPDRRQDRSAERSAATRYALENNLT